MHTLALSTGSTPLRSLLAIGCHADDLEIGCGGTLLQLTRSHPGLSVTWVVLCGGDTPRGREARESAEAFLADAEGDIAIQVHGFRDGYLPFMGGDVKDAFEGLVDVRPDLVLTHTRDDRHQDHRLACELTWNTFRDHLVLEYEIPKWDGDLGRPNVYVPLTEALAREKTRRVLESFPTQASKHWFDEDVLLGLMRLRGMECNAPERYAEAFTGPKVALDVRGA